MVRSHRFMTQKVEQKAETHKKYYWMSQLNAALRAPGSDVLRFRGHVLSGYYELFREK